MEKERKIKIIAIVSLIIVVIGLTIGYASLSSSLDIRGTATVDPIKFGVHFENLKLEDNSKYTTINGDAYIDESRKSTAIDGIKVAFKAPNDYVIYSVDIVNDGDINVEISSFNVTGIDNNEFISYTLRYNSNNGNDVMTGDVINANSRKKVMLKIYYKDLDYLPEEDVSLNLGFEITYVQSNNTDSSSGSGEDTSWKYKVDETGTITAYNYAYGPVVKVPEKVDGVAVTTITKESFLQKHNWTEYFLTDGSFYEIISEDEPNYTYIKEKLIDIRSNVKDKTYICKDKNTCYNIQDEENGVFEKVSMPEEAIYLKSLYIKPDPGLSSSESIVRDEPINSLDLSEATNLIKIDEGSFENLGIKSINFGENSNLQTIGSSAFANNQISGELVIPPSVTSIGTSAFTMNQISSLVIPLGVTSIGSFTFSNNQLNNLVIPPSITSIGENAFFNNQIGSLDLSGATGLTTIGNSAFWGNQISSLDLGEATNLTTIEKQTFGNNQISGKLVIPEGVTTIGNHAFYENQISSLTISSSVTIIGEMAFSSNPISSILVKRTKEDFLANVTVVNPWNDGSSTITYQP